MIVDEGFWCSFFGLYVEHVILQSTSAGDQKFALRICLLEGCVLPNLQRPSTQKTILCQRRFLIAAQQLFPLCLGHASVLKCVFLPQIDLFCRVFEQFCLFCLVVRALKCFMILACKPDNESSGWQTCCSSIRVSCTLMYSHVLIKDIPHEAFVSWMQKNQSSCSR